jgi:hypothetical protein
MAPNNKDLSKQQLETIINLMDDKDGWNSARGVIMEYRRNGYNVKPAMDYWHRKMFPYLYNEDKE